MDRELISEGHNIIVVVTIIIVRAYVVNYN